jgi:large subunit ribosomal protein L47
MSAAQRSRQLVAYSSGSRALSSSAASCSRTLPRPVATRPASQRHTVVPANVYELKKAYPRHPLLAFFNNDFRDIRLSADTEQKTEVTIPAALRRMDLNTDTNSRGWLAPELRTKSSLELHQLWYKCLMERNRIHTTLDELQRTSSQGLAMLNDYNGHNINRRVSSAGL